MVKMMSRPAVSNETRGAGFFVARFSTDSEPDDTKVTRSVGW
jgi:hypothetical protein